MQVRGPEQPHWDHPWVLSLTFPLRWSGAWAICLSTISIWGKSVLTKSGEWLSWGKNQVMYSQCAVVMRSLYKVYSWPVLCKREVSPEETHTRRASKSHRMGSHMCPQPWFRQTHSIKWCSCFQGPWNTDIALAWAISLLLCAPNLRNYETAQESLSGFFLMGTWGGECMWEVGNLTELSLNHPLLDEGEQRRGIGKKRNRVSAF